MLAKPTFQRRVNDYIIAICLVLPVILASVTATAAEQKTRAISSLISMPLKPGAKFIRRYPLLRDWRRDEMTYHVNLPPDFHTDRRYPILLEWHGKGGSLATNVFPGTYRLTGHIHVGLTYPEGCRGGTAMLYATEEYVKFIRHVYEDVVRNFNGNPSYVFIGGFSAGGFMATGPGISLMIRANIRKHLRGVVAGGCNWMCNPKYANKVDLFFWYADNDSNSYNLPNQIPHLKKYARSLVAILHKGAGHRCDNNYEGPYIRKFFALHGPDKDDFQILYRIEERKSYLENLGICFRIKKKRNGASVLAEYLLNLELLEFEKKIKQVQVENDLSLSLIELWFMLPKHLFIPGASKIIRDAIADLEKLIPRTHPAGISTPVWEVFERTFLRPMPKDTGATKESGNVDIAK